MQPILASRHTALQEGAFDTAKGELTVTIIEPGFNKSKGVYYPKEVLERDAQIFAGAKMFGDHQSKSERRDRPEDSVHRWVGQIGKVWTEASGAVKATAKVFDQPFKDKLAALSETGLLPEMGVSIRALGRAGRAVVQGVKTQLVESLYKARSVDFVTWPAAGGRVEMFESEKGDENDVDLIDAEALLKRRPDVVELIEASRAKPNEKEDEIMSTEAVAEIQKKLDEAEKSAKELKEASDKTIADLTKERDEQSVLAKKGQRAEVRVAVQEAVAKTDLPEPSKKRVVKQFESVESDDGLDKKIEKAVESETEFLKELAEAGKVKNVGESKKEEEDGAKELQATMVTTYLGRGQSLEEAQKNADAYVAAM
ncbi:hypothetical protein LCGC14_2032750 [marine sediment metagenome]|uniref:Uncharacterized protein n=1 Tax=marine sediment metagenome TaxID=412755 RepID=A0A0F9EU45_9ZZZZ